MRALIGLGLCFLGLGCSATTSTPAGDASSKARPNNVTGRLPPAVIQEVVRNNFKNFRTCYEDGLSRDRMLLGRVFVRFVIDRNGVTQNPEASKAELWDPVVVNCVVEAFRPLRFPAPENGIVTVVYPLMFSPNEETRQSGDCAIETKIQGLEMIFETERCKGFAVMNTVLRQDAPVDEAFAANHLKGFEGNATGTRASTTIAGKPGWSSIVAAGNGQPYRKLFITQYDKGAAQLVSCQDEEASQASERCDNAMAQRVKEHAAGQAP